MCLRANFWKDLINVTNFKIKPPSKYYFSKCTTVIIRPSSYKLRNVKSFLLIVKLWYKELIHRTTTIETGIWCDCYLIWVAFKVVFHPLLTLVYENNEIIKSEICVCLPSLTTCLVCFLFETDYDEEFWTILKCKNITYQLYTKIAFLGRDK